MSYGWAKDAEMVTEPSRGTRWTDPFTPSELAYIKEHAAYRVHGALITFLVERLMSNVEQLHAIVADLAAVECPVTTIVSYVTGDEDGLCPTCDAVLESDSIETTDHEPSCPWRRARDWVDGHVAVTDPADQPAN